MTSTLQLATDRRRRSRAWTSIAALVLTLVAIQPLTVVLADLLLPSQTEFLSFHSWDQYLRSPAPDVVFIGSSRVVADVDRLGIAQAVSHRLGRPVTVGLIGSAAAEAPFQDGAAYRIMHRSPHPRLVVLEMSEFQYNTGYTVDSTSDLWLIGNPPDLGFDRFALHLVPDGARFARGVALPVFAYSPYISIAVARDLDPAWITVQRIGHFLHHGQVADPYIDFSSGVPVGAPHAMTDAEEQSILDLYSAKIVHDYAFDADRLRYLAEAAYVVRAGGAQVAFAILPEFKIDSLQPDGYADFLARAQEFAGQQSAPFLDDHLQFRDDRSLWNDPSHLNPYGRSALAPTLGEWLAPLVPAT